MPCKWQNKLCHLHEWRAGKTVDKDCHSVVHLSTFFPQQRLNLSGNSLKRYHLCFSATLWMDYPEEPRARKLARIGLVVKILAIHTLQYDARPLKRVCHMGEATIDTYEKRGVPYGRAKRLKALTARKVMIKWAF